jgi:hypothetical protein
MILLLLIILILLILCSFFCKNGIKIGGLAKSFKNNKTFKNNKLYHDSFNKKPKYNPQEVRFTKVLTKYSTEYNNSLFIQNLCQQLGMDKKDVFSFFLDLKNKYDDNEILGLFENYEITKLDINRIYRYIDKFTKVDAEDGDDVVVVVDSDLENE